jgi:hypothetical protein
VASGWIACRAAEFDHRAVEGHEDSPTVEIGDEGVLGAPGRGCGVWRRGDQVTYDSLFNAIMGEY